MTLKTLKDFADIITQEVGQYRGSDRKRLKEELREAANDWLNVFKKNREADQDDESGVDEAFIRIFFNLEAEDK